jgi:glycosidase
MLTQDDIIYFIVTDRFANGDRENDFDVQPDNPKGYHGGDFAGIVDRIPYLKNLGVTALWITPVMQQTHLPQHDSFGYHGYWPLDFERIDPHLYSPKPGLPEGDKQYLKELVDILHAEGIKVILDTVVNHVGYDHPSISNPKWGPIKPHWFNAPRGENEVGDIGSWLTGLPDLKQDEPEVADYFTRVIADWIEATGVDCIRMDTAKHVESLFWHYYKSTVKGKYPTTSLLGEVLEFNIDRVSAYQQHFAFDSLFDFPLQSALQRIFIHGESLRQLSTPFSSLQQQGYGILNQDTHYTNHNLLVTLLDNHDLGPRFYTRALERAGGNRGWALYTLRLALTLLLTTRGIPQIYYGTELGMEGGDSHDNRRDMPWQLLADGLEPESSSDTGQLFQHVKTLINFRKNSEALRYGDQLTLYVDHRQYVYLRKFRDEWVIVALNLDEGDMHYPLEIDISTNHQLPPHFRALLMSQSYVDMLGFFPPGSFENGKLRLVMPKRCAGILVPASAAEEIAEPQE